MTRILACIDASSYATGVCDLATWSAKRLSAEVELLHVVQRNDAIAARHDLSGAIGLGVKTDLLEELTRLDETQGRLAIEQGRVLLTGAEQRLRDAGLARVQPVHRHGGIVETIIEREAEADLVIIGKRGASGEFATGHIGSKVERVVRSSVKPVLVAPRETREIKTVIVAFDGSPAAKRAVAFVDGSPLFEDLEIHIVMAGAEDAPHRELLAGAAAQVTGAAEPTTFLTSGRAEKVIGDYMLTQASGILVMGAYGHSPLRTLIVGSTTTTMIRTVHAPVLLVR